MFFIVPLKLLLSNLHEIHPIKIEKTIIIHLLYDN
jgi:hypothetical protein